MFFSKKNKIIIKNKNITIEAKSGSRLYNVLIDNNIKLPSLCGGNGQCGKCKVRIEALDKREIAKPTKKERLMLALINLEAGYRLACEYVVKQDIVVDTEEWVTKENYHPEIVSVKVNPKGRLIEHQVESNVERNVEPHAKEEKKSAEVVEKITQPDTLEEAVNRSESYESKNGLILVQYENGIRFFYYSTSIDNISHSDFIKTDETLVNLIDDNTISDFIYNRIRVPDFERMVLILDKIYFDGSNLLDIVNYYTFELGEVFCEVLQPVNSSKQFMSFFRILSTLKPNSLIISLDNLNNIYYVSEDGGIYNLNLNYVLEEYKLEELFHAKGKNPIVEISEDFSEVKIKDSFKEPDSVSISAKLKAVENLLFFGVVTPKLEFLEREKLIDKIPIEILVKHSYKNDQKVFYLYRKKGNLHYIDEKFLEKVKNLKLLLNSVFEYVEKHLGRINNVAINSFFDFENLTNSLLNLDIVPKKYSKKVSYFSGDPSVLATRFFSTQSIKDFISKRVKDLKTVTLYNDENFNTIFEKNSKR